MSAKKRPNNTTRSAVVLGSGVLSSRFGGVLSQSDRLIKLSSRGRIQPPRHALGLFADSSEIRGNQHVSREPKRVAMQVIIDAMSRPDVP